MTWSFASLATFVRVQHLPFLFLLLVCCVSCSKPTKQSTHQSSKPEAWSFLENYGYLPRQDRNSANLLGPQELKKAIQLMQKYANIPQTGILDKRTLAKMSAPRCGLPDVIEKRSKRFVVYGPKWGKSPITWSLVQPSRSVPIEMARRDFTRAFALWANATPLLKFRETTGEADIRIGFFTGQHGCGPRQSFDGPGTKLAHAFAPPKGDVHFDDDEDWMSETEGLSLFWTALHEFGHSLGFAHTADEKSIMFPYYQDHGDSFQLPEVDKAGIRYLYGDLNKPNKAPTLPSPGSDSRGDSTTPNSKEATDKEPALPCNIHIDAIASIRGDIFIFKGNVFWWLKQGLQLVRREPIPISQYFAGFPADIEKVDAVYERKSDQKIMFFVGKQYWLFAANQYYRGPLPLSDLGLPYNLGSIDAITEWGHNGRVFVFSGSIYWRMDESEKRVEVDYPRDMTVWRGVPIHLDAAFTWQFDSGTYFFKGTQFWKFENTKMQIAEGYPKLINDFWFRELHCRRKGKQIEPFNLVKSSNAANKSQTTAKWPILLLCLSLAALVPCQRWHNK